MDDQLKAHRDAVRALVDESNPSPAVLASAPEGRAPERVPRVEGETKEEKEKSPSTRLVEIAVAKYTLGVTADGESFAVGREAPHLVQLLRGDHRSMKAVLARQYFSQYKATVSSSALNDALTTLDAMAQTQAPQILHLRVAEHDGVIWWDLGDNKGRAARIDPAGWEILECPPVLFRRTKLVGALCAPTSTRNSPKACNTSAPALDELWGLLNVAEKDRPLLAGWLVSTLFPGMAHPVLMVGGEQGTGKSTAAQIIVRCIDNSPVPLRKAPRDAESWVTAAAGSWVVALDNLSTMPDWLSDSICRAVTGDGDVRRKLYTDGDLHTYAFRRCVLLNGIDVGALRGDLADRMLPIQLTRITEDRRIPDSELWPAFDAAHPAIIGGILDLTAAVMDALPHVRLKSMPRMADFARVLACIDRLWGTDSLSQYQLRQVVLAEDSLAADPFVVAIAERFPRGWEGTSAELFAELKPAGSQRGWPSSARAATALLRRQAPVLRKTGWMIDDDGGANHHKVLRWVIRPPASNTTPC